MGMQVQNNSASMLILGQVNKNQSDLQKQLKKVATGMKLVGAGDGAAEYSISEKMRVKIRALGQDEINVQNGASLLHTAEGGVQQQIELMKSIKEKVLAANNDTATDQDRQTIQKEISQSYDQMQDIAAMTSYNGRRVLLGGHLDERVFSWEIKDEAVLAPDSDAMNVIPDQYDTLDGVKGPFDVFKEYSQKSSTIDALGLAATQNFGGATDGTANTITMDLSSYGSVAALNNVGFAIGGYAYVFATDTSKHYQNVYGIIDINGTTTIDLNSLRTMVSGTTTIASAFASLMAAQAYNAASVTDAGGTVTGVKLTSTSVGAAGNSQTITVSEGTLRSYDIDYSSWFAANHPSPVASYLNGKGFRAYCATDSKQWFNFIFTDGTNDADKPKSGTAAQDIKSILIDVSKVTDAASLVQTIYDQAEPVLTGADPSYNHHMRVAADTDKGILTLYDDRRFNVNTSEYDYQEKGAKIADGVFDNVIKSERDIDVDEVIIQHTDKASKNIHLKIPRTTLDHVFGYRAGEHTPDEYNVLTRTMRERLLGIPPDNGILDNGLEYLTAANTLIGAQTNHMEAAQQNIITERTNTTAADSTIRDADMAKTMADYARDSILSNAAMSMLSQANQSAGSVVSLLKA